MVRNLDNLSIETAAMNNMSCGGNAAAGELKTPASIAMAYVPKQKYENGYKPEAALDRGTLFPGLELPFKNYCPDGKLEKTAQNELRALAFVVTEIGLFLNSHPDDKEAFQLFKTYVKMYNEYRKQYVAKYGPISKTDMADASSYNWINSPWPWEYDANRRDV